MNVEIFKKIEFIFQKQNKLSEFDFEDPETTLSKASDLQKIIENETRSEQPDVKNRIQEELAGFGPLAVLIDNDLVTEVLVNSFDQVYYEMKGTLIHHDDHFFSDASYMAFIDRLSQKCHTHMNREKPFVETQFGKMRVTMIFSEISRGHCLLSIRKQPKDLWTLSELQKNHWCNDDQAAKINQILTGKKNFLVVGGTGSGKTSFMQAMLQAQGLLERNVIIEDTQELHPPNRASVSLLTRQDPSRNVSDVSMDDLLKRALRLRPDRLVIGEIRGPEAKSLLMALATGHQGSFGSLHARSAPEALLRLEMLIQMGAPEWTLQSIRKLMAMTIEYIIVLEKQKGVRQLEGIYRMASLEESGLTIEKIDVAESF